METIFVEVQRLINRSGLIIEMLATARLGGLVRRTVNNEQRERDFGKRLLQSRIRTDDGSHRRERLRLFGDKRIAIHRFDYSRIAREILVLERDRMRMRYKVAYRLQNRECEIRRRHLEREILANEAGNLGAVIEGIQARYHATGAMTEQENRDTGLARLRELDEAMQIGDIFVEALDVIALALGLSASSQIDRVSSEPALGELLADPLVHSAVRVEAMADCHDRARRYVRSPRPHVQLAFGTFDKLLNGRVHHFLRREGG